MICSFTSDWGLNYETRNQIQPDLLLVLVLLVVGLIGTVISTPGLHFVINSAARWVPGLDIAGVTGGWRNLTLTGVSYQMPGVKVKAGEFHLAVDIGCLKKANCA